MDLFVKVRKVYDNGKPLKGVCSVTLDNMFTVHGVRIMETDKRFIVMPYVTFKDAEGKTKRKEIFRPNTSEARQAFEDAVLAEFEAVAAKEVPEDSADASHDAEAADDAAENPDNIGL